MTDNELFQIIERDYWSFVFKTILNDELIRKAPHLNGLIVEYGGDLPRGEGLKPDIMVSIMSRMEKDEITRHEQLANKLILKLYKNMPRLGLQMMIHPLINCVIKKKTEKWEYYTHEQVAKKLGYSIQQYNRSRARAKLVLIEYAKIEREAARAKKALVSQVA